MDSTQPQQDTDTLRASRRDLLAAGIAAAVGAAVIFTAVILYQGNPAVCVPVDASLMGLISSPIGSDEPFRNPRAVAFGDEGRALLVAADTYEDGQKTGTAVWRTDGTTAMSVTLIEGINDLGMATWPVNGPRARELPELRDSAEYDVVTSCSYPRPKSVPVDADN